jgi:hypothetical protein
MDQSFNSSNYQEQLYQNPNQNYQTSYRLNFQLMEVLVLFVSIVILVTTFVFGVINKNRELRDEQRYVDILGVIEALDNFYNASASVPSRRYYPISRCSNSLNEVDYEYTLRETLTGKRSNVTLQTFVDPDRFPVDDRGIYTPNFSDRSLPYRCPNILQQNANSYQDNYPSCEFSSNLNQNFCYLYTSTNNGDSYQIGYYSESQSKFVVFSRFRDQQVRAI